MTREEAKEKWNLLYESGFTGIDIEKIVIDKIYDDFENRTCETCSKNISFECEIYNKLPFGQDEFGCIKWSKR